jgi:uncharacterized membrane protein HdeD (DUF308 family)
VASTQDDAGQRAAYWAAPVVRAVPLAGLALWITFTSNHSASFGLLAFGIFGIVGGLVLGLISWFRITPSRARPFFVAQAAVTVVAGVISLSFRGGGVPWLFFVLTLFAAISGLLELYSGVRTRKRYVASTDWITVGGLTVLAAIVFLVIPPGYSQTFHDPDGVTRVLDSAVVAVGILGAYAAIAAVFLLIAGFSAKWGTQSTAEDETAAASAEGETRA